MTLKLTGVVGATIPVKVIPVGNAHWKTTQQLLKGLFGSCQCCKKRKNMVCVLRSISHTFLF